MSALDADLEAEYAALLAKQALHADLERIAREARECARYGGHIKIWRTSELVDCGHKNWGRRAYVTSICIYPDGTVAYNNSDEGDDGASDTTFLGGCTRYLGKMRVDGRNGEAGGTIDFVTQMSGESNRRY